MAGWLAAAARAGAGGVVDDAAADALAGQRDRLAGVVADVEDHVNVAFITGHAGREKVLREFDLATLQAVAAMEEEASTSALEEALKSYRAARSAWAELCEPAIRWLLSTVPSVMVMVMVGAIPTA